MPTVMRQGHRLDTSTARRLAWAEDVLGFPLVVVQGSYNGTAVAASAATHAGGGVVDIRTWNLSEVQRKRALVVLRKAGLIAWYRTKAQGFDPHIHAVELASTTLSPSAARQRAAWRQGKNGLASGGDDDGPKVDIPTAMPDETSQSEEDDDMFTDADRKLLAQAATHAKQGDDRINRLSGTVDKVYGLVKTIAAFVPVIHRQVGYLMPDSQKQTADIAAIRGSIDAALAAAKDDESRKVLEQIRALL